MHGLVNCTIQRFVTDSYGEAEWVATALAAGLECPDFEPMWTYERDITFEVLRAASAVLDRGYEELLEDIGTYMVSHSNYARVRRLLRFSGVDFVDFLHSLDDLPERARLAVPDLILPRVALVEQNDSRYSLKCYDNRAGWGHVFVGLLRAMADDYGALVFLDYQGNEGGVERISVSLLETAFSEGREFDLGARSA